MGASAAELSKDLVDANAGPHRDGLGRAPFTGAARRDDGAGSDEAFEVGCVGVERAELGHGTSADRHHGAFAGLGDPHRLGEAGPQFPDADRSCRICVHMCTQAELHGPMQPRDDLAHELCLHR